MTNSFARGSDNKRKNISDDQRRSVAEKTNATGAIFR